MTFYFNPDKPLAERPPLTGVYRRIGRLLWEFRGGVGLGVLLSGLSTLLFVLLPFPIKWLVDGVLIHRSLHITWIGTVTTATAHDKLRAGALLALIYVLIATAQALVNAASFYVIARTALLMIHTLRSRLVGHLRTLSLRYFANTSVGELIFRAINDARSIQEVMIFGLTNWATLALRMALMTLFMAILDPVLTLVALTVVPALAVTIRWLSGRIQSSSQVSRQHLADLTSHIEQTMGAIRAVQVFGEEGDQRRRFNDISLAFVRAQLRFRLSEQTLNAVTVTITALATGAVIYVATLRVINGAVTVGALFVFLTYMQAIYQSMNQIMFVFGPFQDAVVGVGRTFQVLDTPADITEREGALDIPGFSGEIRLESVRLDHEDGRVALAGVDLVIRRGEKVALVGQTGAGKTSVLHLIPRLHDVTGGRVTIDGHDVRDLSLVSLRRLVSMVPQEPLLFSTTIRDNILYGRLGATTDEVEEAARAARADVFISDLLRGYDTEVGDRGVKLSVGQQQRISIARAFLKDSPILLLDEPTSALDAGTEADFLDSLERLMAGRTVVIVAHRLSTIRSVDRIYVLDHGRVVEEGTPAELLERDGPYRRLHRHQSDPSVTPAP
ncbi:MAG TPA: ABC transporter ATP-binding protein [Acidimicrobiales bacterium]|nr:ABC transporter ATP-binding protein [Acidimicrobiales bacterium]